MSATDRLINLHAFDFSSSARLQFVDSFREQAAHHYEHNRLFKLFWQKFRISPHDIQSESDVFRAPPLLVTLFKEERLCSCADSDIALTLSSSGTSGQKSQIFLTQKALDRVFKMTRNIHDGLGMHSEQINHYFCFGYDPHEAKDVGTAYSDELITTLTPRGEVHYALKWNTAKQTFVFAIEPFTQAFMRLLETQQPMRLVGFPAFIVEWLEKTQLKCTLPLGSFVETGGGWKKNQDKAMSQADFAQFVAERLNLPTQNIRDLFGMVEHGVAYLTCEQGYFHIPNYARACTRHPSTLAVCQEGEIGLLNLICTYNDAYPAISLLTTDWGRIGYCHCSTPGPTLEVLGRAGSQQHQGCAFTAAQYLRNAS